MIQTLVRALIGNVPSYTVNNTSYVYDIVEYMVCAMVLLFLLMMAYRMITAIFGKN